MFYNRSFLCEVRSREIIGYYRDGTGRSPHAEYWILMRDDGFVLVWYKDAGLASSTEVVQHFPESQIRNVEKN